MVPCQILVLLWAAVYVSTGNSQSQCATSSMQISYKSKRNESGHWRSTVSFKQSEEESFDEWEVDVAQKSHLCGSQKALETTFHFTAPPPGPALGKETATDVTVACPTAATKVVPAGYELYAGVGYYKFHHDVTTWNVARGRCVAEGGHLMIINSQAEVEVVKTLFNLNPSSPGSLYNHEVFIGVHKEHGVWVSLHGEPMPSASTPYARWNLGEPNYNDECVSTLRPTTFFNNIGCEVNLAYICEIDL